MLKIQYIVVYMVEEMEEKEVLNYADLLEIEFLKLYEIYGRDCDKSRLANCLDSFWYEIGQKLFLADHEQQINNCQKSKIPYYDITSIYSIVNKYLTLCDRFGVSPKIQKVCDLLNMPKQSVYKWHDANNTNGLIFKLSKDDAIKDYDNILYVDGQLNVIKDYAINNNYMCRLLSDNASLYRVDVFKMVQSGAVTFNENLLDSSAVGAVARANNDEFIGKLWDSKRLQARVDASQQIIASRDSLKGFLSEKNTPVLPMLDN